MLCYFSTTSMSLVLRIIICQVELKRVAMPVMLQAPVGMTMAAKSA